MGAPEAVQATDTVGMEEEIPRIVVMGPRSAGKQTLVNRLIRYGKAKRAAEQAGILASHKWKLDTKYYTADVNVVVARTEEHVGEKAVSALAWNCQALVLVFDVSDEASFVALESWASKVSLEQFEVLLCIGNKADQLSEHQAHKLIKESNPEHWQEVGGRLFQAEPSDGPLGKARKSLEDARSQYSAWCLDNGVEYVEACALDEVFDSSITIDGDQQGVSRIRNALHAHMWPGLKMKPTGGAPALQKHKELAISSGDESDFSVEYEILPGLPAGLDSPKECDPTIDHGSSQPRDQSSNSIAQCTPDSTSHRGQEQAVSETGLVAEPNLEERLTSAEQSEEPLTSAQAIREVPASSEEMVDEDIERVVLEVDRIARAPVEGKNGKQEEEACELSMEQLEEMMRDMAGARARLQGMPDDARRQMAADMALRMLRMFGDVPDDDED